MMAAWGKLIRTLGSAALFAWPWLLAVGVLSGQLTLTLIVLGILLGLRVLLALSGERQEKPSRRSPLGKMGILSAAAALGLVAAALGLGSFDLMFWYPLVVNGLLLSIFGLTLWRGRPMCERFARLIKPELSAAEVVYTRRVTVLWCGFFIVNGAIAALTIINFDLKWWTLWNGGLSYVAALTLGGGEYAYRRLVFERRTGAYRS